MKSKYSIWIGAMHYIPPQGVGLQTKEEAWINKLSWFQVKEIASFVEIETMFGSLHATGIEEVGQDTNQGPGSS